MAYKVHIVVEEDDNGRVFTERVTKAFLRKDVMHRYMGRLDRSTMHRAYSTILSVNGGKVAKGAPVYIVAKEIYSLFAKGVTLVGAYTSPEAADAAAEEAEKDPAATYVIIKNLVCE